LCLRLTGIRYRQPGYPLREPVVLRPRFFGGLGEPSPYTSGVAFSGIFSFYYYYFTTVGLKGGITNLRNYIIILRIQEIQWEYIKTVSMVRAAL